MRRVLKINPDNPSALNFIGYTYVEKGVRMDDAERMIRKAHELRPKSGYIMDSLGWLFFKRGNVEEARGYISNAYKQLPEEPTIIYHLGRVEEAEGNKAEAARLYRKALKAARKKEEPDLKEIDEIELRLESLSP
jgi:Flp pilus assembly protein TadD